MLGNRFLLSSFTSGRCEFRLLLKLLNIRFHQRTCFPERTAAPCSLCVERERGTFLDVSTQTQLAERSLLQNGAMAFLHMVN